MWAYGEYAVNVDNDVSGMSDITTKIYRDSVVDSDGSIKTGTHLNERVINISGYINARDISVRNGLISDLHRVCSPSNSGVLRYEGEYVREIDADPESTPKITYKGGWPNTIFTLSLVALNPNWRDTAALTKTIASAGTSIYYGGSRACGMRITITASGDAVDMQTLTVTNGSTAETITFRTGGGVLLNTGDVLVVDVKQVGVDITLNDVNALERIDFTNTVFPNLYPGNNTISWLAHGDESQFTVGVAYTPLYLGK